MSYYEGRHRNSRPDRLDHRADLTFPPQESDRQSFVYKCTQHKLDAANVKTRRAKRLTRRERPGQFCPMRAFVRYSSIILALVFALAIAACSFLKGPEITDQVVENYINAYEGVKRVAPQFLSQMDQAGGDPAATQGDEAYHKIEAVIKESGFSSYAEFVQVNAKIAAHFSLLEGRGFADKMEQMHAIGTEEFDQALANPDLPPAARAELERARQEVIDNYARNKPYAEGVLKATELATDEKTLEVLRRHQDRLRKVFAGRDLPQNNQFFGRELN